MAGLLDFIQSPAGVGLLSAVAGGMAGARRGTPVNNLGRGALAGLTGYAQANDQIRVDKEKQIADQMRQMQMDQMRGQMETQKAQQTWKAGLPGVMAPKLTGSTQQGRMLADQNAAFGAEGVNPLADASAYDVRRMGQNAPEVDMRMSMTPNSDNYKPNALGLNFGQDQQAVQDYMMRPESPYADKLIERQLFPERKAPIKVGERLIDPETYKPVYEAPVKEDYNKPFLSDGSPNPAYQQYATTKAREGATRVDIGPTRVENITTQESEGSKVYGKGLGEMQIEIQKQGFKAPSSIANLDRMSQLLEGVDSGRFSGAGLEAARFAKSFGLNVDEKLGNKQAAEALAIEMALKMRDPGSGPMTDKDFDNYLNTVPSLAKTAEGRKQITATLKAKAKRDMEIAKMTREYAKKNRGVIDDNFLDIVADYMAQNPVVPVYQPQGDVRTQADRILKGQ
jgi:hypothetical protein